MSQLKFSSRDFPESERISAFQDIYAAIASLDIQPYSDQPSFVEMIGQLLPNLGIYAVTATPHLSRRTHAHIAAENNDDLALLVPLNGIAVIKPENGDSIYCQPGDALLVSSDSIHQAHIADTISIAVINVPAMLIAPRVSNLGECLMKKVASVSTPELRLLVGYTKMLIQMGDSLSPDLASLASTQIHDLLTLLLGAKQDEMETAKSRGLRATRFRAVKCDILGHITDSELSIDQVALRQGISPQYIRALFHSEETTFADYVTGLRLKQTYRLLCNPLYTNRSISTLAFDMGFSNLSWFNRAFKQRFGLTPSEVRNLSRRSEDQS